jgi:hypothetical protein
MSLHVRQDRGELVVEAYRPPTETGYSGRVLGPLPPRMREAYNTALRAVLDEADLGAPKVRLDFTTRRRRPVLVLGWDDHPTQIIVDNEGATQVVPRGSDAIEWLSDVVAWTQELYGSLEPLTDEYVRYAADRAMWVEAIAEARRRELEPETVPVDAPPVAGSPATSWRERQAENARDLAEAKSKAQLVLDEWPSEADGFGKLEQAIALLGECERRARPRCGGGADGMTTRATLTPAQEQTRRDVADGQVHRGNDWMVYGARSDVLGRLEEKLGLVRVDWDGDPIGSRRSPKYPVVLTDAGRTWLAEATRR